MSLVAGGIAAGAMLASAAGSAVVSGKMNRRATAHAREMWDKQGVRELEYWNMQNAYNDPSAQMQRLKDAGLNPNLVYGDGGATPTAAPLTAKQANSVDFKVPNMDISGVVQSALAAQQTQANIARTNAETRSIDARTAGQEFQNTLNEEIGLKSMMDRYTTESEILATQQTKQLAEWEAFNAGAFAGKATDDRNSPIAKAIAAGYAKTQVELENAKKLGDIRRYESTIKAFEANLTKQGYSPNSPWYVKILGDLISKTLGTNPAELINSLTN